MLKSGEMLSRMLVLVTNAHAGQFDKAGKPYILHPLKVMHYVGGDDEELHCIALGHDVIEDTTTTYRDLRRAGMTWRVVDGIVALTKVSGESLQDYKERVFANKDAMLVKLADLRHNSDIRRLKGVSAKDIARMTKYHEFHMEITARLAGD